jgi:hypothetical protein
MLRLCLSQQLERYSRDVLDEGLYQERKIFAA